MMGRDSKSVFRAYYSHIEDLDLVTEGPLWLGFKKSPESESSSSKKTRDFHGSKTKDINFISSNIFISRHIEDLGLSYSPSDGQQVEEILSN